MKKTDEHTVMLMFAIIPSVKSFSPMTVIEAETMELIRMSRDKMIKNTQALL